MYCARQLLFHTFLMPMRCDACNREMIEVIHVVNVVSNERIVRTLCQQCAKEQAASIVSGAITTLFDSHCYFCGHPAGGMELGLSSTVAPNRMRPLCESCAIFIDGELELRLAQATLTEIHLTDDHISSLYQEIEELLLDRLGKDGIRRPKESGQENAQE